MMIIFSADEFNWVKEPVFGAEIMEAENDSEGYPIKSTFKYKVGFHHVTGQIIIIKLCELNKMLNEALKEAGRLN